MNKGKSEVQARIPRGLEGCRSCEENVVAIGRTGMERMGRTTYMDTLAPPQAYTTQGKHHIVLHTLHKYIVQSGASTG